MAWWERTTRMKRTTFIAGIAATLCLQPQGTALAQSNAELLGMIEALQMQIGELKRQVAENPEAEKVNNPPKQVMASGNRDVSLALSGQVNRAALVFEDGDDSGVIHVDNDNSSTRIRLIGKAKLDESWSAGSQIEVEFSSNSSSEVDQNSQRNVGANSFTERKLELYFDHDDFGRLWLGQGDTASNHSSEQDLSGTGVAGDTNINEYAGGLLFHDDVNGVLTNISIGDAFSNLDGRNNF